MSEKKVQHVEENKKIQQEELKTLNDLFTSMVSIDFMLKSIEQDMHNIADNNQKLAETHAKFNNFLTVNKS